MTESDVLPFLTHEWRLTRDIALDVYEAEGRRGSFESASLRVCRALRRLEEDGRAEMKVMRSRGRPAVWRLAT